MEGKANISTETIAMWNHLKIERPPTATWHPKSGTFATSTFVSIINKALEDLLHEDQLNREAATLSRLIYRMKSKFRSDKGLKSMEKLNRALLNYLKLSISRDYKYLKDNCEINNESSALPSRQMLQYVIIRTQGFAKLLFRVEAVARLAAHLLKTRITLGQAWTPSTIAYSVVSRIWVICKYLLKRCYHWLTALYPFVEKLKLVGLEWRPWNDRLPSDLTTWTDAPWNDVRLDCTPELQGSESIFSLIKNDETKLGEVELPWTDDQAMVMTSDSRTPSSTHEKIMTVKRGSQISNTTKKSKKFTSTLRSTSVSEIGEKISREAFTQVTSEYTKREETKRKSGLN